MNLLIIICFIVSSCAVPPAVVLPSESHHQLLAIPDTPRLQDLAYVCADSGIPLGILTRLIETESSWDPAARNINIDGSEDIGLGQLNSAYLGYYADKFGNGDLDPYCPEQNITITARYMVHLYKRTGSWEEAAIAYKIGPSRVADAGPRLREIARYVARGS